MEDTFIAHIPIKLNYTTDDFLEYFYNSLENTDKIMYLVDTNNFHLGMDEFHISNLNEFPSSDYLFIGLDFNKTDRLNKVYYNYKGNKIALFVYGMKSVDKLLDPDRSYSTKTQFDSLLEQIENKNALHANAQ